MFEMHFLSVKISIELSFCYRDDISFLYSFFFWFELNENDCLWMGKTFYFPKKFLLTLFVKH